MNNREKTMLFKIRWHSIAVLFFLLLITSFSLAGKKPDFSGEWTLNNSKSELGEFSWAATTLIIDHDKKAMTIIRKGKGFNEEDYEITEKYTLKGEECINNIFDYSRLQIGFY